VQELTIAGNLLDMFRGIAALGADVDPFSNIRTGSVLIERMTLGSAA
jgi:PmbA protein